MFKSSASGKIIILGEHAVVHGSLAIVAPLKSKWFKVVCRSSDLSGVHFVQKDYDLDIVFTDKEILHLVEDYNGAPKALLSILQELQAYINIEKFPNIQVTITKNIYSGGFGGSTAFITAITKAILGLVEQDFSLDDLYDLVYKIENKFQGNISGVDTAAIVYAKPIVFNKKDGIVAKLDLQEPIKFMIINSGKVSSSTEEVINWVEENNSDQKLKQFIKETNNSVRQFQKDLKNNNRNHIKSLFNNAEKWLEDIDVVTNQTQKLITQINKLGGAAKVSGAGTIGIKEEGSGAVICYADDYSKIEKYLDREEIEYFYTEV